MTKVFTALTALLALSTPSFASTKLVAETNNEGTYAQHLATMLKMTGDCGLNGQLGTVPASFNNFLQTHYNMNPSVPIKADIELAAMVEAQSMEAKAPSRTQFCAAMNQNKAMVVAGVKKNWDELMRSHAAAKH
jgi:hypothetical protein